MSNNVKQKYTQKNNHSVERHRKRTHLSDMELEQSTQPEPPALDGQVDRNNHEVMVTQSSSPKDKQENTSNNSVQTPSSREESLQHDDTLTNKPDNSHDEQPQTSTVDPHSDNNEQVQAKTQEENHQTDSIAEQAGNLAGVAMRNVKKNSRNNPLYFGLGIAFATAALGVSFSTFPIFLSLPVAGVLLGISVWLMGHVGIINLSSNESESNQKFLRFSTIGSLLVAQIVVTDIFLFTRLGSVDSHQSGIIITWLITTAVEVLAAALIVAADLHRHH